MSDIDAILRQAGLRPGVAFQAPSQDMGLPPYDDQISPVQLGTSGIIGCSVLGSSLPGLAYLLWRYRAIWMVFIRMGLPLCFRTRIRNVDIEMMGTSSSISLEVRVGEQDLNSCEIGSIDASPPHQVEASVESPPISHSLTPVATRGHIMTV